MRVLLVDDDSLICWSLDQSLTARGHRVTQTQSGTVALSLLKTGSFDVILTDWRLPGADGFEIVAAARASSPDIPVIMMSAHGNSGLQEKISTYKINCFLDKPLIMDDVARLVESFPESRKA